MTAKTRTHHMCPACLTSVYSDTSMLGLKECPNCGTYMQAMREFKDPERQERASTTRNEPKPDGDKRMA